MNWNEIKDYTQILKYFYKLFDPQIDKINPVIPRIPSIIDPTKSYPSFKIECKESKRIVLLNNQKAGDVCKITLNYNYFTADEIFDIFKIPRINSYNQVGHIIHLNLDKQHQPFKFLIGSIILSKTNAKTVIQKIALNKILRNIECEVLAGDNNLRTWHVENNLRFFIDYGKVYWNSKLANERNSLKLNGTVVDPFCGCGAFVLYALKQNCRVYCNDLNPASLECVEINVKNMGKSFGTEFGETKDCVAKNTDAALFLKSVDLHVDHFIFNLPDYSLDYVKFLKNFSNFTLHCYFFAHDFESALKKCEEKCFMAIEPENIRFIRKVSPSKDMYKLTIKNKS